MHGFDPTTPLRTVRFDRERLALEDIADIARGSARPVLSDDPAFRAVIARGADFLERLLREDGVIYGVTTGYGDSCTTEVPPALVAELLRRGWPEGDIRKALGMNVLRVMRNAEGVAARLERQRTPSTATIEQLDRR